MPNIQSAKKALRQSERRHTRNLRRRRAVRDITKRIRVLASGDKHADAAALLPAAYKALDKAAQRHIIDKNTASRKKSRLARLLAKN